MKYTKENSTQNRFESNFRLHLKEILNINKRKPVLNTQLKSKDNTLIIAKHQFVVVVSGKW